VTSNRMKWRRRILRSLLGLFGLVVLVVILFAVNGMLLAAGEAAQAGRSEDVESFASSEPPAEVTIVAYNVAKGWAPKGGASFHDSTTVEGRLRKMADEIRAERPDLIFLSEIMTECTPCPVDQVKFLARELEMPYWAFGENYNFGLPFYRVVGGNAILSRFPLSPVANPSLIGRKPFYETKNSRRSLFASLEVRGKTVLLGSLHNDSYDIANNSAHVRQLLEFIGDRPCVLAGDFNAKPQDEPIQLILKSKQFAGAFDGPPTYPADKPDQRIDFVLAPSDWEHVETRVLDSTASDHRPMVARFRTSRSTGTIP